MKKKILFVTKALWIGGIETALINLLNNLDYSKYEVSLLIVKAELDLKDQICSKCKFTSKIAVPPWIPKSVSSIESKPSSSQAV